MPVACKYCNKMLIRQSSLYRHIREVHKYEVEPAYAKEVWGFKCLEYDCDTSFQRGSFLIDHLEKVHDLKFEKETIVFANIDEFTNWKQTMEEVSYSYYVISKYKNNRSITYYNCNRSKTGHSGIRKLDKQYKRRCKSQGYCHINSSCTSQIKMLCDGDGKVTVNFQKTHYGHEADPAHIRLSKLEREKLAVKLVNGISPKKDRSRDRIVKLIKGRTTKCTSDIFRRHCEAQQLKNYAIEFHKDVWNVTNESGDTYIISQEQEMNCCADICSACDICRHIFKCTCIDSNREKLICKHIHYFMICNEKNRNVITHTVKNETESDIEISCAALDKSNESTEEKLNRKINNVFCKLQNFDYNTLDDSTLEKIHFHLSMVDNLTNLPQNTANGKNDFIIKENTNKRYINPQLRLFSTNHSKKKIKKESTSCTIDMTDMERSETKKMLQKECALVKSRSSKEDHLYCKI